MDKIIDYCVRQKIEYRERQSMSRFTSFKIGGAAECAAFPSCEEEIAGLIKACNENQIKYYKFIHMAFRKEK